MEIISAGDSPEKKLKFGAGQTPFLMTYLLLPNSRLLSGLNRLPDQADRADLRKLGQNLSSPDSLPENVKANKTAD